MRSFNRIIQKIGSKIQIRPRIIESNKFTYPESSWFETKAIIYDRSGLSEIWQSYGVDTRADYICVLPYNLKGSVNPFDHVKLPSGELLEILNIVDRSTDSKSFFIELLLRRIRQ